MTLATVEAVQQQLLTILGAIDPTHLTVLDGEVAETPAGNYCVLWMGSGLAASTRFCYTPGDLAAGWQITCVGRSQRSCMWVVDKVRGGMPRRIFGALPVEQVTVDRPLLDKSVPDDLRWSIPLVYRLDSPTT